MGMKKFTVLTYFQKLEFTLSPVLSTEEVHSELSRLLAEHTKQNGCDVIIEWIEVRLKKNARRRDLMDRTLSW